jgi:hypothetical protein
MSTSSQREAPAPVPAHATNSPDIKRRRFLLALGAGGAGAAAVATQSLARPIVPAVAPVDADSAQGYRETDHIRDYYATTRI